MGKEKKDIKSARFKWELQQMDLRVDGFPYLGVKRVPWVCLNNIQTSPNPPGAFWEVKESGKGTGRGKQEWRLGRVKEGDIECVIRRENQWVPPRQIKAMTSSDGKEQGETRAPTVTHSASRGPSSGMDKKQTMCSQWMGSQIPQEENKSLVGTGEGKGEMEKETERDGGRKGDP